MKIFRAKFYVFALLLIVAPFAQPETGFVIQDIELEGAKRITLATLLTYMPLSKGERLTTAQSKQVMKALYATGFFKDITLSRRGNVLLVSVKERPAIAEINIDGNKKIKDDDIKKAFQDVGLVMGRIYNDQVLDTMQNELERIYYSFGRYGVKLESEITPLPRNRVKIDINIREGLPAKIRHINVVGNEYFTDEEIIDDFESGIPGWWALFSTKDQYAQEKLSGDIEKLRSFYLDRGYVNFRLESVQVTISPDKKDIYLTLNINEGNRFKVRNVDISGDTVVDKGSLLKVVKSVNPEGEYFNNQNVTDSTEYINNSLGNIGYAFSETNVDTKADEGEGVVDITFYVVPNKRIYVRRIEFDGNERSRDLAYRRETRQMEGSWYSNALIERSKVRIQRLRFVEEVEVEKRNVPGADDQVDVMYTVKERLAGSFNIGAGYSDENGATFTSSVSHNNVFGTGNRVALSFTTNEVITSLNYNYENPYYTDDGVSRGYSLFLTEYDTSETLLTQYVVNNIGARLYYQIPVSEFSAFGPGIEVSNTDIKEQLGATTFEVRDFIDKHGGTYDQYALTGSYIYDTRNRSIFASRGSRQVVSVELNPNPSDLQYFKINLSADYYWPVTKRSVLHANYTLAGGQGLGDLDELPFYEKYSTGGISSLRGFESRSLGPRSTVDINGLRVPTRTVLGGDLMTLGSLEYFLPPPEDAAGSIRILFFYDIGNVFKTKDDFDSGDLRSSVGIAFKWLAPIGAMTFSFADPIKRKPEDEIEKFQFTIGGAF